MDGYKVRFIVQKEEWQHGQVEILSNDKDVMLNLKKYIISKELIAAKEVKDKFSTYNCRKYI